jgi:hypothetical protein
MAQLKHAPIPTATLHAIDHHLRELKLAFIAQHYVCGAAPSVGTRRRK